MTAEIRARLSRRAELHPNWTGGSWVSSYGRVFIRVPDAERHLHPTIRPDGYIQRYHYVWNVNNPTDPVQRGEIIHHLNHDKTDDRIENLKKWKQSPHAKQHTTGLVRSPEAIARMRAAQQARRRRERELAAAT